MSIRLHFHIFIFVLSFSMLNGSLYAGNLLTGKIADSETGASLPGASVRILNTSKGTYSNSRGIFRLPEVEKGMKLKFSSLGYESRELLLSGFTGDTLIVSLKPSPVMLSDVMVEGEILPEEIVRRAISRKEENLAKLKTFSGELYSKLVMELGGSVFSNASSDGSSISIGAALGGGKDTNTANVDLYKMFVFETFSRIFRDYEKNIISTTILQRRQTANIKPQDNIMAIGNFLNFYDDNLNIINTSFVTPLSKDALANYKYRLAGRSILDGRYVYILDVIPDSRVYPLFEGKMKIVEGTYNLIELDLTPSEWSSVSFVDSMHIQQKFAELEKDIWHPNFLEIKGKARIEIIRSLMDLNVDVIATSIYGEARINIPLPDSIYEKKQPWKVSVSPMADSAKLGFWEQNSLRDISPHEKEMYIKIDSIAAKADSAKDEKIGFGYSYMPYLDYNRASTFSLGLSPVLYFYGFNLETRGLYSFGIKKSFGRAKLRYSIAGKKFLLQAGGSIFSDVEIFGLKEPYPRIINTAAAAIFFEDYYNYYRNDGWSAFIQANLLGAGLGIVYEQSRQFPLENLAENTGYFKGKFRRNPKIMNGEYKNIYAEINIGGLSSDLINNTLGGTIKLCGLYGIDPEDRAYFYYEAEGKVSVLLFPTGYGKMSLDLFASAGYAKETTPIQYKFRLPNGLLILHSEGSFYSASMDKYGGSSYFLCSAEFNTRDLWWRWLGLPRYEGRGLELILASSAARYFNKGISEYDFYSDTGNQFYAEAGFGLGRIPIFISNVIYLRTDFRWGIGRLGSGNFGWGLGISTPF